VTTDGERCDPGRLSDPEKCAGRPTGTNSNDRILWRLVVSAPVAPVAYRAEFEVPVFCDRPKNRDAKRPKRSNSRAQARTVARQPVISATPVSRIRVSLAKRWFHRNLLSGFPESRNRSHGGRFFFSRSWMAVTAVLFHMHAPLIFQDRVARFFDANPRHLDGGAVFSGQRACVVRSDEMKVNKMFPRHRRYRERKSPSREVYVGWRARRRHDLKQQGPLPDPREVRPQSQISISATASEDTMEAEWLALKIASVIGLQAGHLAEPMPQNPARDEKPHHDDPRRGNRRSSRLSSPFTNGRDSRGGMATADLPAGERRFAGAPLVQRTLCGFRGRCG